MVNKTRSVAMIFNNIRWGNDILTRRLELKLTQEDISKLTGISTTAISQYETGVEDNPKLSFYLVMCNVYDLDPREYFELER